MPAPRRRVPREVREREMLEVAGRLFSERGYHEVSMDEIAEAAGVSKPMVYSYFDSKEGLFLACVKQASAELVATIEEVTPPSLPEDMRLWRGFLAVFTYIEEHSRSWSLLYPDGPQSGGPFATGAARANEEMGRMLTAIFRDSAEKAGIDPVLAAASSEPIAHALVAAVVGLGSWWMHHPGETKERQALRMMNLAWMGLGEISRGNLWWPPRTGERQPASDSAQGP